MGFMDIKELVAAVLTVAWIASVPESERTRAHDIPEIVGKFRQVRQELGSHNRPPASARS